jgi:hypothetical protein
MRAAGLSTEGRAEITPPHITDAGEVLTRFHAKTALNLATVERVIAAHLAELPIELRSKVYPSSFDDMMPLQRIAVTEVMFILFLVEGVRPWPTSHVRHQETALDSTSHTVGSVIINHHHVTRLRDGTVTPISLMCVVADSGKPPHEGLYNPYCHSCKEADMGYRELVACVTRKGQALLGHRIHEMVEETQDRAE